MISVQKFNQEFDELEEAAQHDSKQYELIIRARMIAQ
jgi:hypothetical protein